MISLSRNVYLKRILVAVFLIILVLALLEFFAPSASADPLHKTQKRSAYTAPFKLERSDQTTTTTTAPTTTTTVPYTKPAENIKSSPVPITSVKVLPPANNLSHNEMMAAAGIPEADWPKVEYILQRENADWNPCKYNGGLVDCNYQGNKAYGIPQSLPGSKMAAAGPDWRTNPITQLRWMQMYVVDRYTTWDAALIFKKNNGWY